jgi:hypothetical protein
VYHGDIFSEMVLGNLVQTSTVMLRRSRLARVRGFDTALKRSGEDYDFHLRVCREGPVAYLDAPSILFQTAAPDRLSGPDYRLDRARNLLATIVPIVARDRDRIRLPRVVIDEVLADAHGRLGECEYEHGDQRAAAGELASSLRHKPRQPRVAALLALSLLPPGLGRGAARIGSTVERLLRGRS